MTIVGARIDGRLIHGQVANLWTTKLNISRIMVIDDEVAENAIERAGSSWQRRRSEAQHFANR